MSRSLPLVALGTVVTCMALGCRSGAPEERPAPQLEIPEEWTSEADPDLALISNWEESFDDPALEGLIEEALANNHDLEAAAARLDAALAEARIAGADQLPRVDLTGGGSRE